MIYLSNLPGMLVLYAFLREKQKNKRTIRMENWIVELLLSMFCQPKCTYLHHGMIDVGRVSTEGEGVCMTREKGEKGAC